MLTTSTAVSGFSVADLERHLGTLESLLRLISECLGCLEEREREARHAVSLELRLQSNRARGIADVLTTLRLVVGRLERGVCDSPAASSRLSKEEA